MNSSAGAATFLKVTLDFWMAQLDIGPGSLLIASRMALDNDDEFKRGFSEHLEQTRELATDSILVRY